MDRTRKFPKGIEVRKESLRIEFRYRGVRCRETLKLAPSRTSIKYAEGLRMEILRRIAVGQFRYGDYFPNSPRAARFGQVGGGTITVGELLDKYLQQAKHTNEQSTYLNDERIVRCQLKPVFGDVRISDLTPGHIKDFVLSKTVRYSTMLNLMIPLRRAVDEALERKMIAENPFAHLVIKNLIAKEKKGSAWKIDPFEEDEIQKILAHCRDPQHANLFRFAFWTGLRTSELMGLHWGDIDWVHGYVLVSKAFVAGSMKGPKTEAGKREVLLLPEARKALEAQKQHSFLAGETVFLNPYTGRPWDTPYQLNESAWQTALKASGVRYRNPYQTRHTYAVRLLSAGENIFYVAAQLGHVGIEMILRHYAKWIPQGRAKLEVLATSDLVLDAMKRNSNGPNLAPNQQI